MALIIIIALGVVLGLAIFKNAANILALVFIALIAFGIMVSGHDKSAKTATQTEQSSK